MRSLPMWVRKALVDAAEAAVVAVGALTFIVPNSMDDAKAQALILFVAVAGATVAAFRRAVLERGLEKFRDKVIGDESEPAAGTDG